ncbi:unnamed protein product [Linum tenue]|uniref:Uncharacterized protein n=2 Tax=Linum tenue TaxID=586396 RepID=A0AAV0K8S5_9ROSI|nr:unnamed protein product [Linum tenue]
MSLPAMTIIISVVTTTLLIASTACGSQLQVGSPKVQYIVTNNANHTLGGARFNKQIGPNTAAQILYSATNFTWAVFDQANNPLDRKNITSITLLIEDIGGNNGSTAAAAQTNKTTIHVSANYIGNYAANLRRQFSGTIYQEVAAIWQWNGKGQAPAGLVTGIAHYVRLQARYGTVEKVKPGDGDRWDQGGGVTARFLVYCNQLKKGFVGQMNRKMRHGYTDGFFLDLLGKPVDHLWSNYKERYGLEARTHRRHHE